MFSRLYYAILITFFVYNETTHQSIIVNYSDKCYEIKKNNTHNHMIANSNTIQYIHII